MVVNSPVNTPWWQTVVDSHPEAADFKCKLSNVVMFDPVRAEDGFTYERSAIERWMEQHDHSPTVREGQGFCAMGRDLEPNRARKAALDLLLRDHYNEDDDELEVVEWDSEGYQVFLPAGRSITLSGSSGVVPPPSQHPRAVADMTADLTRMFKILDPLRGELESLVNVKPPKVVVIGDESAGKSTVLEQLIRMPLFPRKQVFCTRLPIHVRMRRPEAAANGCSSVTMSVVTSENYRLHGYDAEPEEPPCTIATASGYHFVQDRMDALQQRLAGDTGGIVADRIIVLDVHHEEVPVLDLIDLPGIVTVNGPGTPEGKVEAIEEVISSQIAADETHGMTSFYLVVVPAGERPNTNGALKYIQSKGLLERALGVFTKSDEVKRPAYLSAFITGADVEDEDEDTVHTAQALGEVKLAKGWTATMLAMPKCMVTKEDGRKTNYYTAPGAAPERLKKQEEAEKQFFGGAQALDVMRELYDAGLAGTGALAAKLTSEYYEYSRGEWFRQTITKLLEHELELKSQRAMLGETDSHEKDRLAADEVKRTLDDGAVMLTERFAHEVLVGSLVPSVEAAIAEFARDATIAGHQLDAKLETLRSTIQHHVDIAVEKAEGFYADEVKKMLDAPIRIRQVDEDQPFAQEVAPTARLRGDRFWTRAGRFVRSLFGTEATLPQQPIELHKRVIEQKIIQLGQYPDFTAKVAAVLRGECKKSSEAIGNAAKAIVDELVNPTSCYLWCAPGAACLDVTVCFEERGDDRLFVLALKTAFIRHLPGPGRLKSVVSESAELRLSRFEEDRRALDERCALDERIKRVRDAARGLTRALDVDESNPLDSEWLHALQTERGLPHDSSVLFTDEEINKALENFNGFQQLFQTTPARATPGQVDSSSAKLSGWLKESPDTIAAKTGEAATKLQAASRSRTARAAARALRFEPEVQGEPAIEDYLTVMPVLSDAE